MPSPTDKNNTFPFCLLLNGNDIYKVCGSPASTEERKNTQYRQKCPAVEMNAFHIRMFLSWHILVVFFRPFRGTAVRSGVPGYKQKFLKLPHPALAVFFCFSAAIKDECRTERCNKKRYNHIQGCTSPVSFCHSCNCDRKHYGSDNDKRHEEN